MAETKIIENPGDCLTVINAAKELGVHHTTVYRWIDDGKITAVSFGGIIFIPRSEVDRIKKCESSDPV